MVKILVMETKMLFIDDGPLPMILKFNGAGVKVGKFIIFIQPVLLTVTLEVAFPVVILTAPLLNLALFLPVLTMEVILLIKEHTPKTGPGLGLGLNEGKAVGLIMGVAEGAEVGLDEGELEGVKVGLGDGVTAGVGDGVTTGVGEGVTSGVGEGVITGVGDGVTEPEGEGDEVQAPRESLPSSIWPEWALINP